MKLCRSSSIWADTDRPARNQILLFTRFWKLCKYSKLVQWDSNYLSHFWQRDPLIVAIFNFSEMKDSLKRGQIKLINSTKNAADFSFIFLVPFYFLINPMPCSSSAAAAGEDQEAGLMWPQKVPLQPWRDGGWWVLQINRDSVRHQLLSVDLINQKCINSQLCERI